MNGNTIKCMIRNEDNLDIMGLYQLNIKLKEDHLRWFNRSEQAVANKSDSVDMISKRKEGYPK